MFYYTHKDKILISGCELDKGYSILSEDEAVKMEKQVIVLNPSSPLYSRRSFAVSAPDLSFNRREDLSLLIKGTDSAHSSVPLWLEERINAGMVTSVNPDYPNWEDVLNNSMPNQKLQNQKKWRVNVVGLGDVGGTLVTGLRLTGEQSISSIGIYDKDENKIKRWEFEAGQILSPAQLDYPEIVALNEEELFDCDMFVFCVSVGVPEIGKEQQDVRLVQFQGNAKILGFYSKLARKAGFKGIFAVVSDPVDLLCKVAFNESNKDDDGNFDFKGLASDQIRGYGLGVMNARACYYAKKLTETAHYLTEGRAFGPHGEGLVIADSIYNYNEDLSNYLTQKTKIANLDVRSTGFKPYIAPALSSGALSLLATIRGEWHYSATFIGGTFFGARNRLTAAGTELERTNLPETLLNKLMNTYDYLRSIYD